MYTDHSSLRWLVNVKDATGRLARWAFKLLLQQYNFEIIHRPGCQNGNADALSRCPYPTTNLNALQQSDPEIDKIREKQRKDPELSEIMVLLHIMCGYQCDRAVNKSDTREVI